MIAGAVLLIAGVILLMRSVIVVRDGTVYVVERLGRYARTLPAGVHVLAPFVDAVRFRYSVAPADEQLADQCITFDNVAVAITSTFRWQIEDAEKASYAAADVKEYVRGVVQTAQRHCISERQSRDLRETTRELQQCVLRAVAGQAAQGGVKILAHDVGTITNAAG